MVSIYKVSSLQSAWIVYAVLSGIVLIRTIFFMPITIIPSPLPNNYKMDVTLDCCINCDKDGAESEDDEPRVLLKVEDKTVEPETAEAEEEKGQKFSGNVGFWSTSNAFHPLYISSVVYTIIKFIISYIIYNCNLYIIYLTLVKCLSMVVYLDFNLGHFE